MTLYIYAANSDLRKLLHEQVGKWRTTDSGFDIPMLEGSVKYGSAVPINLGIRVAAVSVEHGSTPSLLLPRSSISGTPLRLSNSIGLIDMGYRGEVIAKVDVSRDIAYFEWDSGTRYFQICQHNFLPWYRVIVVDNLTDLPVPPDTRGEGGFGSTGK